MMNRVTGIVFSMTGGAGGGILGLSLTEIITTAATTAIVAFIGAIVGFCTHEVLAGLKKRIIKKRNDKAK